VRIIDVIERGGKVRVRVRVETADDLWVLKNVVKPGDVVVARTLRDVKIDGEGKRRLPMVLAIRVKNVYFQPFATRLRIHGVIIEGPDGYGLRGSHHTFNIDVGSELEIVKESWSESEIRRLRSASSRWVKALLVATDFDELSIAIAYHQGIRYLMDRELPGISSEDPNSMEYLVSTIVKYVLDSLKVEDADFIVVGSPAVLRDYVVRRLSELLRGKKVLKDSVSVGGRAGIEELLRRDVVKGLLKELTTVEVEEVISEFMKYLSKRPDRVAYGLGDVEVAVKANAIEKLLVCEELLSSDVRDSIEELISRAESRGAKVIIVPKESPTYMKVKGLGCLVAILRYDLSQEVRESLRSG